MKQKRLYSCIFAFAMLLIASANAMAGGLTLKNVTFLKPGEKATMAIGFDNDEEVATIETKIVLPEGLSFVAKEPGSENFVVNTTERTKLYNVSLSQDYVHANGAYLAAYTIKKYLPAGKGDIFTFEVNVAPTYTGAKEIRLTSTDISMGDDDAPIFKPADFVAKVVSTDNQMFVTAELPAIKVGEEQTLTFNLDLPKGYINNTGLRVKLPQGLSVVEDSEQAGTACPKHNVIYNPKRQSIIIFGDPLSLDNKFALNKGTLCSVKVIADNTFVDGSEITVGEINGTGDDTYYSEDITLKVTLDKTATGINGINADEFGEGADGIYQLNGVRTDKLQRGVNIVVKNGKAVKVVKK